MSKSQIQQDEYNKLILDYVEFKNQASMYLLKMAQIIAEAKQKLNRKLFKKFLKEKKIDLRRVQANKMIAVYELSKSDSRLTLFINKEGVEKSHLLTTIKNTDHRITFAEKVIDVPFSVRQTKLAINKMNVENKLPDIAIEEVQNKIGLPKTREQRKTIALEVYEKLKKENDLLRQKIAELEQKGLKMVDESFEEKPIYKKTDLSYLG